VSRDRVLVEDGEIAYDIAASVLGGEYRRSDRIVYDDVRLAPAVDYEQRFFIDDRQTRDCLGVINTAAIATAEELVETVERVADRGEVDR
jgi:hypothetical protein